MTPVVHRLCRGTKGNVSTTVTRLTLHLLCTWPLERTSALRWILTIRYATMILGLPPRVVVTIVRVLHAPKRHLTAQGVSATLSTARVT